MTTRIIDNGTGEVLGQTEAQSLILANEQFKFTPTGLIVTGEPEFEVWENVGQQLKYIEGAVHWWIGDWLNYGEQRWGEMYSQALDETGFKYQTLADDKYTSNSVKFSRRRENLPYSHHREVAPLPPEAQDRWLDMAEKENLSQRELRKRIKRNPSGIIEPPPELPENIISTISLNHADIADFLPTLEANSIDVIITDPPYPREFIQLYEIMAEQAARILKPGGSLLTMCGQLYQYEVQTLIRQYLNYQWMLSYQTPGGQSPQIWPKKVNTFWKPILWFVKGEYDGDWHGDVVKSDVNDKRFHDWGQSESGITRLVEAFSEPGSLILDPFLGGGTTAIVAHQLGRRFIGIDIDQEAIAISKQRLNGMINGNL